MEQSLNITIWNQVTEERHLFLMAELPPEDPGNIPLPDLEKPQLWPQYEKIKTEKHFHCCLEMADDNYNKIYNIPWEFHQYRAIKFCR